MEGFTYSHSHSDDASVTALRKPVLSVPDVAKLEQAIAADGTSLAELMDRAGRAIASEVRARFAEPVPVVVLCGSGNNGGDGWVCARTLAQAGWPVTLVCPRPAEQLAAEPAHTAAMATLADAQAHDLSLTILVAPDAQQLELALGNAHCIVDAILGTGFSGSHVREPYATWIELANQQRTRNSQPSPHAAGAAGNPIAPFIIAADVPSGMSAQTGEAAQPCICADETVTMIVYKPGLLVPKAAHLTGAVVLAPLIEDAEKYIRTL